MTELERRIEDGEHYEHIPSPANQKWRAASTAQTEQGDDIPSARGIFVGYRYTEEEYTRLKSADPRK